MLEMTANVPAEGREARSEPTISEDAPVAASAELEIAAAPETVWETLTAIEDWPAWNPDVKSVVLQGGVAEGSVFRWKAGPGTITSTIQRVDRPRLIAWTGKTFGLSAVHVWHLEQRDGKTLVRTEESFEGFLAGVFRRRLRKTLETSLADGLRYLKAESERRAAR
jgi:uncharacterized protein YndB with AHSA1/START domain